MVKSHALAAVASIVSVNPDSIALAGGRILSFVVAVAFLASVAGWGYARPDGDVLVSVYRVGAALREEEVADGAAVGLEVDLARHRDDDVPVPLNCVDEV